jgi:hypothetical protein
MMASENNNRDVESFALGMIVLALLYFIFLKKRGGCGCKGGGASIAPARPGGCTASSVVQLPATNPGVSLGGQSYSGTGAFGQSSVVS